MAMQDSVNDWFKVQGWRPHEFQTKSWEAYGNGEEVLIQAPTGSGKTYAGMGGLVQEALDRQKEGKKARGVQLIWIAPIRALTKEIQGSAERLLTGVGLEWRVGIRTGDTSSAEKSKQRNQLPEVLITTPESLHVLLAMKGAGDRLKSLKLLVVDEWHELMGTKRGTQVELASAWLRQSAESYRCWGISATIGNLEEALKVLLGPGRNGRRSQREEDIGFR
ncbi:MAG: DEAD/DEAH box helicase, partial [Flavobacteriales bacterium]